MNKTPLLSIITVSFNSEKTIEDTILSVINQTYKNIEYIIIDGGSTDGTLSIIKKYEKYIYQWKSEPDKGIYDAMNKGISLASGDIIGIINSDDWYNKNIFQKIIDININNPCLIIHGNLTLVNNNIEQYLVPNLDPKTFYRGTPFFHPTLFVPKMAYKQLGVFNLCYPIAADFDLMLRLFKSSYPFYYLNDCISYMRTGGESCRNEIKGYKEVCKIAISHGYSRWKVYYSFYQKIYFIYRRKLILFIKRFIKIKL